MPPSHWLFYPVASVSTGNRIDDTLFKNSQLNVQVVILTSDARARYDREMALSDKKCKALEPPGTQESEGDEVGVVAMESEGNSSRDVTSGIKSHRKQPN